jgi:hypothetical protein
MHAAADLLVAMGRTGHRLEIILFVKQQIFTMYASGRR